MCCTLVIAAVSFRAAEDFIVKFWRRSVVFIVLPTLTKTEAPWSTSADTQMLRLLPAAVAALHVHAAPAVLDM
jgi:hypothetical protein